MELIQIMVLVFTVLGVAYWGISLIIGLPGIWKVRSLLALEAPAPSTWPKVSVIIPACNEAETLGGAMAAHLQTDYPRLEIALIDDRSTDNTGAVVDQLAQADPRILPIHITTLPPQWLGKVHAMHQGQAGTSGDWLLFTDADVYLRADTLRRSIALCEAEQLDFLTAIPWFRPTSLLIDAAVTFMARAVFGGGQAWKISDSSSPKAAGFGAFMLVRRSTFDRTEGFPWLRMEVADDLALGLMIKQSGARCAFVNAKDLVHMTFYPDLDQLKRSLEKGGFAIIGRYSLARVLALTLPLPLLELGPLAGFAPVGIFWLPILGIAGLICWATVSIATARWARRPLLSALLSPVGALLNSYYTIRSGLLGWRRGGITWRGTFYPTARLREGMRIRFP